jgi:outer membrane lipoprotein-sorting protein
MRNKTTDFQARPITRQESKLFYRCGLLTLRDYNIIAFLCLFSFAILSVVRAQPSGDEILRKIDENMTSNTRIATSKMVIHGRRNSRTIVAKSYLQGEKKSFTEYLAPAREKGTKMLKLDEQLWTYSPQTDRTIRISGHMLRQSVMGSDLSYEDMLEDQKLQNLYEANVAGEESVLERPCWILDLTAKKSDIAYHSRKIWVDKERFIPLKEERFAKSGKLLKSTTIDNVERMSGRWVATEVTFKDQLQKGKGTQFILDAVEFDVPIPDHIFSKAALRK